MRLIQPEVGDRLAVNLRRSATIVDFAGTELASELAIDGDVEQEVEGELDRLEKISNGGRQEERLDMNGLWFGQVPSRSQQDPAEAFDDHRWADEDQEGEDHGDNEHGDLPVARGVSRGAPLRDPPAIQEQQQADVTGGEQDQRNNCSEDRPEDLVGGLEGWRSERSRWLHVVADVVLITGSLDDAIAQKERQANNE